MRAYEAAVIEISMATHLRKGGKASLRKGGKASPSQKVRHQRSASTRASAYEANRPGWAVRESVSTLSGHRRHESVAGTLRTGEELQAASIPTRTTWRASQGLQGRRPCVLLRVASLQQQTTQRLEGAPSTRASLAALGSSLIGREAPSSQDVKAPTQPRLLGGPHRRPKGEWGAKKASLNREILAALSKDCLLRGDSSPHGRTLALTKPPAASHQAGHAIYAEEPVSTARLRRVSHGSVRSTSHSDDIHLPQAASRTRLSR